MVDSDTTLICKVFNIANRTANQLEVMDTPKSNKLLERMSVDQFGNVSATFDLGESGEHVILLNEKLGRRGLLTFSSFILMLLSQLKNLFL